MCTPSWSRLGFVPFINKLPGFAPSFSQARHNTNLKLLRDLSSWTSIFRPIYDVYILFKGIKDAWIGIENTPGSTDWSLSYLNWKWVINQEPVSKDLLLYALFGASTRVEGCATYKEDGQLNLCSLQHLIVKNIVI